MQYSCISPVFLLKSRATRIRTLLLPSKTLAFTRLASFFISFCATKRATESNKAVPRSYMRHRPIHKEDRHGDPLRDGLYKSYPDCFHTF